MISTAPGRGGRADILREILAVVVSMGFFLSMALHRFHAPGAMPESLEMGKMAALVDLFRREPFFELLWKGEIPLQLVGYHGLLISYLLAPFYACFGPGDGVVRFWHIGSSVISLFLTYFFVRENFGRRTALLALALLAAHPSFVMGAKVGVETVSPMMTFSTAILFLGARGWNTGKKAYGLAAAFLMGLGLWMRVTFFWFVAAFLGAAVLAWLVTRDRTGTAVSSTTWKTGAAMAAAFLTGLLPTILKEVRQNFSGVGFVGKAVFADPANPCGIGHYLHNAPALVRGFHEIWSGRSYSEQFFENAVPPMTNDLYPWAVWAALLACACLAVKNRRVLLVTAVFVLMLLQTPVSHNELASPWLHLYFFYPFVQILLAVAFFGVWDRLSRRPFVRAVFLGMFLAIPVNEALVMTHFHRYLSVFGGIGDRNMAIYDLVEWLKSEPRKKEVIFAGPYLYWQAQFLSGYRKGWQYTRPRDDEAVDAVMARDPREGVIVVTGPRQLTNEALFRWAARQGLRLRSVKWFLDAVGNPVYAAYPLRDAVSLRRAARFSMMGGRKTRTPGATGRSGKRVKITPNS